MLNTSDTRAAPAAAMGWLFARMPRLLLLGGLLASLLYYGIAVQRGPNGHPAASQTDTLIYLQYARAMAAGHPYVFVAGDTPSTGSTSHLFPAILSIFFRLGMHGDALLSAVFAFNALCYLLWLQLFWQVAKRLAPGQAVLAAALVLLNGHLIMTVAGLTDMPLFTTLAWALLVALLDQRFRLAALLLVLAVFARPEGFLLAAGLAVLAAGLAWRRPAEARRFIAVAACGVTAVAAVFLLNDLLTGTAQFQSVANKGYLKTFPLLGALGNTARDFSTLVREILLNANGAARQAFFLPVAGGLLAIAGVAGLTGTARDTRLFQWWLGCSLAAFGMIATSDWQGIATDRYFLWLLPTWYLLAACGVGVVTASCRAPRLFPALAILLVGYEIAAWPYFASYYASECGRAQAVINFARDVDSQMPPKASVGVLSAALSAYEMEHRTVRHLPGMVSPAFAGQRDMLCAVERLKHSPACRFDYLLLLPDEQGWCSRAGLLGDPLLVDLNAPADGYVYTLCKARWETFPAASLLPLDPAVSNAVASLTLVDRLDVGFQPDEHRCGYRFGSRLPDQVCKPCVATGRMGSLQITEVGQPVIGWDEFHVHVATPGRPLRVVMRTSLDATCTVIRASNRFPGEGIHLNAPLQLRPIINGQTLPVALLPVTTDAGSFSECILDIPAEAVTSDPLEIVFAGDHIALAYWFYQ